MTLRDPRLPGAARPANTAPMMRNSLAVPARATASSFALILLAFWLAGFVPPGWDGSWTAHIVRDQPTFVDRFFPFDGAWYQRIAAEGYAWDPTQRSVKQDIAFFPLWPVIVALANRYTPAAAHWLVVALSACFAFASVCAVHCLARETLPPRAAVTATWLYALYPAACFLLLSYPTGVMNLLCALAVLAVLRRRFWAAAFCAGIVTAAGPLGLGTAMMVWVCAAGERWATYRQAPRWIAGSLAYLFVLGMVSVAGLLAFIAWQARVFGDPFAFMAAQDAWAAPVSSLRRLPHAILQLAILPDFGAGFAYAVHAFHARSLMAFQAGWEKALNCAAEGIALLMVPVCLRFARHPVMLQGAFTLLLFVWFHSSFWQGHATLRLTYCALTTFLGLAWLLQDKPRLALCVSSLSATLLFSAVFLIACGYHVV